MRDDDQQLVDEISHAPRPSTDTSNEMDEMDEWVVDIEGRLEDPDISHAPRPSMDSDSSDSEEEPSIFGKWECWDDFGASFIPERKKWQIIACMTHWFGLNLKSYLEYMQGKVDLAWSNYREVDEQFHTAENSKRFIEHLLVSSCFLIFVIVFSNNDKRYRKVILNEIGNQNNFPKCLTCKDLGKLITFLEEDPGKNQRYMVTMKYQIPWFVLEAIYTELSNIGKLLDIPIHKLALTVLPRSPRMHPSKEDGGTVPQGGFKHLVHIFHWSRTLHGEDTSKATNKTIGRFHIPSATELQLSQTVFMKDESGSIDVSYSDDKRLTGVMQLTLWHILQYSSVLYESLISFEQWYRDCGIPFTAYIACMACLLKTEADVQVLRESGVIPGTTFDDKDVLCCVNELKTFISGNLILPNELVILEEKVMAHHKKSVYRVIGDFKKLYCSNPWIIFSIIAGILLFALTFIQTIYGTLSYYKQ
ncbi:UPF0481 protein At3g47200-like [Carex rostrata]